MAEFKKLEDEIIIASIKQEKVQLYLTNFRIFKYQNENNTENSSIIPINNIDSFGLIKTENQKLLFMAVLSGFFGFLLIISGGDYDTFGFFMIIAAIFLLIAWQSSKKTGVIIYSVSGKTEIFVESNDKNQTELLGFVESIQTWLFLSSKRPS